MPKYAIMYFDYFKVKNDNKTYLIELWIPIILKAYC